MKSTTMDIHAYDKYIVAFSGGKDSTACLLSLLDAKVDRSKIELWHHDIDGREGTELMDWACTRSYCKAFAAAFELPIYFSWRQGGFEREMLRNESLTAPVSFETPDGLVTKESQDRPEYHNTRQKFPQVSADLSVRWCSAYLKIDVLCTAIRNQKRFEGIRTLVITGERGEESPARSGYEIFEPHKADLRDGKTRQRHIDHYRPVLNWVEIQVWAAMRRYRVHAHPAYYLGFGRVSCLMCIFGNANQFASARFIDPAKFAKVKAYETEFGCTIKRNVSIDKLADSGKIYPNMEPKYITLARGKDYDAPIFMEDWVMPNGAFAENCGPQ